MKYSRARANMDEVYRQPRSPSHRVDVGKIYRILPSGRRQRNTRAKAPTAVSCLRSASKHGAQKASARDVCAARGFNVRSAAEHMLT